MSLKEVKPGIFIDLTAVIKAECVHQPRVEYYPTGGPVSGQKPELKQAESHVLTLTLCDGSVLIFTDIKEITEVCKELVIKNPSEWIKGR